MATIRIDQVLDVGATNGHTATDWQVAKDENFVDLVLDVEKDPVNLTIIRKPLRNEDGSLYDPYDGSYARARLWYYKEFFTKEEPPQPEEEIE